MAGLVPAIHVLDAREKKRECALNPRMTGTDMPTIAFFYGIAIRVYFVDHPAATFLRSLWRA
jgi:hypothetical protein